MASLRWKIILNQGNPISDRSRLCNTVAILKQWLAGGFKVVFLFLHFMLFMMITIDRDCAGDRLFDDCIGLYYPIFCAFIWRLSSYIMWCFLSQTVRWTDTWLWTLLNTVHLIFSRRLTLAVARDCNIWRIKCYKIYNTIGGFHKWGYPSSWMVYNGKSCLKWMMWRYPY
jgi:hypothetical protein